MDDLETFKFLFEIFKDQNKSYFQNVMGTLGFVLLAIGWVVTSEKSRSFLASSALVKFGAITVVGVIALIHSTISIGAYYVSAQKFNQLVALKFTEVQYYEMYKLNGWHVKLNLLMNLAVFGLLMLLIFNSKTATNGNSNSR